MRVIFPFHKHGNAHLLGSHVPQYHPFQVPSSVPTWPQIPILKETTKTKKQLPPENLYGAVLSMKLPRAGPFSGGELEGSSGS